MIWSGKPRFAFLIGAATLVPVVALVWLGARVLQQDRDSERQRRRERLDVAAGRLALDVERRLQEAEERLPQGEGVRLLSTGLGAGPGSGVLYQPDVPSAPAPVGPSLAAAELLEFKDRNLDGAARAYRTLTQAPDPHIRAMALVALARVRRQMGDRQGALQSYAELERMGSVIVGGQPAALVALQGRCAHSHSGDIARIAVDQCLVDRLLAFRRGDVIERLDLATRRFDPIPNRVGRACLLRHYVKHTAGLRSCPCLVQALRCNELIPAEPSASRSDPRRSTV